MAKLIIIVAVLGGLWYGLSHSAGIDNARALRNTEAKVTAALAE